MGVIMIVPILFIVVQAAAVTAHGSTAAQHLDQKVAERRATDTNVAAAADDYANAKAEHAALVSKGKDLRKEMHQGTPAERAEAKRQYREVVIARQQAFADRRSTWKRLNTAIYYPNDLVAGRN